MIKIKAIGTVLLVVVLGTVLPYLIGLVMFPILFGEPYPKYGTTLNKGLFVWFLGFVTCFWTTLICVGLHSIYESVVNDANPAERR